MPLEPLNPGIELGKKLLAQSVSFIQSLGHLLAKHTLLATCSRVSSFVLDLIHLVQLVQKQTAQNVSGTFLTLAVLCQLLGQLLVIDLVIVLAIVISVLRLHSFHRLEALVVIHKVI